MKKLNYFLSFVALSGLIFTACDDTSNPVGPNLNVTASSETIEPGGTVTFNWRADAGDAKLETFTIRKDGAYATDNDDLVWNGVNSASSTGEIDNSDDETYLDTARFTIANAGAYEFVFTVTDKDALTGQESITITVESSTTPLSSPLDGTWQRVGSTAGTGLSDFGLKWTSNTTTNAVITKNTATKLVQLANTAWTSITTQQALIEAVDAAADMAQYTGISVTAGASYDDVIATINGDVYYMIKIDAATVTVGGAGTTITVSVKSVHK